VKLLFSGAFLMTDAANCVIANQVTPHVYYNIERMRRLILSKGGKVKICLAKYEITTVEYDGMHNLLINN